MEYDRSVLKKKLTLLYYANFVLINRALAIVSCLLALLIIVKIGGSVFSDSHAKFDHVKTLEELHYIYNSMGKILIDGSVEGESEDIFVDFRDKDGITYLALSICLDKDSNCDAGFVMCYNGQLTKHEYHHKDELSECKGIHGLSFKTVEDQFVITSSLVNETINKRIPSDGCFTLEMHNSKEQVGTFVRDNYYEVLEPKDWPLFRDFLPVHGDIQVMKAFGRDSNCLLTVELDGQHVEDCQAHWYTKSIVNGSTSEKQQENLDVQFHRGYDSSEGKIITDAEKLAFKNRFEHTHGFVEETLKESKVDFDDLLKPEESVDVMMAIPIGDRFKLEQLIFVCAGRNFQASNLRFVPYSQEENKI